MPRPTDYDEKFDAMAYVACAEGGFTDLKLSRLFDVCKATIANWKREHPSFLDSVKAGKDAFDCADAEMCLLKRVKGYKYKELTHELTTVTKQEPKLHPVTGQPLLDELGEPVMGIEIESAMVLTKQVTKHMAPDVKGIEMFLTNRNPGRWRRIKHVELTGKDGGAIKHSIDPWEEIVNEVTGENDNELPNRSN